MFASHRLRCGAFFAVAGALALARGATLEPQAGFAPRFEQAGAAGYASVLAPDGKFYLGGDFAAVDGAPRARVVRFNADGSLDTGYVPAVIQDGAVRALALDGSGRLLVGGSFTLIDGASRGGIARFETSGALDTTFAVGTGFSGEINALALDSAGRVVATGSFDAYNGTSQPFLARLTNTGALDGTFAPTVDAGNFAGGYAVAVQADNKVLLGAWTFSTEPKLRRLNENGSLDTTFNAGGAGPNGTVRTIVIQPADGGILVGGEFSTYNGASSGRLVRLLSTGARDAGFNVGASVVTSGTVYALALAAGGKIALTGDFSSVGGATRRDIARLNADGTVDTGFDTSAGTGLAGPGYFISSEGQTVVVLGNGAVFVGGEFTAHSGAARTALLRCTDTGALDATFAPAVRRAGVVRALQAVVGGKWLVGGDFDFVNDTARGALARLNADGTLDATFDAGTGFAHTTFPYELTVRAIVVRGDGRIDVGGYFTGYNGTTRNHLARLDANGALDATFNPGTGPSFRVNALEAHASGAVLAGGDFNNVNGASHPGLARFDASGALDATFATGTGFSSMTAGLVRAFAPLANGSTLIGGGFVDYNGAAASQIVALTSTGAVDPSFAAGAGFAADVGDSVVNTLHRSGARNYVGGTFTSYQGAPAGRLLALIDVGTRDGTFGPSTGFDADVNAVFARANNTVIAGGAFSVYNGATRHHLALLDNTGAVATDLNLGTVRAINPGYLNNRPANVHAFGERTDGGVLVGGTWLQLSNYTSRGLMLLAAPAAGTPPTIVAPPANASVLAGALASFTVDAAGTGTLTYQWQRLPAGGSTWGNVTNAAPYAGATSATLTVDPTTYAMNGDQFRCTVANGNPPDPTSAAATLTVRVAPILPTIDDVALNEGSALAFTAVATDPGTPAQALTFALKSGAPAGATINATTGAFAWTPTEAQGPGSFSITVVVTKADTTSAEELFTVTVAEVNLPPALAAISTRYVNLGGALAFTVTATDADLPTQTLAFSTEGTTPTWATINPATGAFSATPTSGVADGTYNSTVRVTDNGPGALAVTRSFDVIVDRVAPRVLTMTPAGLTDGPVDRVTLALSDPILFSTFTAGDVVIIGPGGAVGVLGVDRVDDLTARVRFSSQSAAGTYTITIGPNIADAAGNALDQDNDGTPGEVTDDTFTATLTLRAPPDLTVEAVSVTGDGVPGHAATVSWTVRNLGAVDTPVAGHTGIALSYDGTTSSLFDMIDPAGKIVAAGAAVADSVNFTIPADGPSGNVFVVVTANRDRAIVESNYANNAALSSNPLPIAPLLTFTLSESQISESDANPAALGTVRRNGGTAAPLTVVLASDDPASAAVPATIVIPGGQSAATFSVTVVSDALVDGPKTVGFTATAGGLASAASLTVLDVNRHALALTISDPVLLEGDARTITVTRAGPTTGAVVVSLAASSPADASVPFTVTIPAGASSQEFTVTSLQDSVVETDELVSVVAEAAGLATATLALTIVDDDTPVLTLSLDRATVAENAGASAAVGTITRFPIPPAPLTVTLAASTPGTVTLPAQVTIPASQASAHFAIGAVNNTALDGDRSVSINAGVFSGAVAIATAAPAPLDILDDDGPRLALVIPVDVLAEGVSSATTATVNRPAAAATDLVVTITSSAPDTATAPATVTIPNGAASATFAISTPAHAGPDGSRVVTFRVEAAAFNPSEDAVVVTDELLSELAVTSLENPSEGPSGTYANVTFRVDNTGFATATPQPSRPWTDRVYLSETGTLADAVLVGEETFDGSLPVGGFYNRTVPVLLPDEFGLYHVLVETNADVRIEEVTRTNNLRVSATPIAIVAPYTVSVAANIETGFAGAPVTFSGHATLAGAGGPAASVLVNIVLRVRGTTRLLTAVTNAAGDFTKAWTPLAGEGGAYTVGAAHPSDPAPADQDSFTLLGVIATPSPLDVVVPESTAIAGTFSLRNLADVALTSVALAPVGAPTGVTVIATLPGPSLAALATVNVAWSVTAPTGTAGSGRFYLRFTSAEGLTSDLPVDYEILAPTAVLTAGSDEIEASMLVGGERIVPVTIFNLGGAASGDIFVYLPDVAWLRLASPSPLPSIGPGESTTINLQLAPAAGLALLEYSGSLVVHAAGSGASGASAMRMAAAGAAPLGAGDPIDLALPFRFRAVSDATGTLVVGVTDEFTFYAVNGPLVAGATVTLRDPFNGADIAVGTSDATGLATFTALPAGYYQVEARADRHGVARTTVLVEAGTTTRHDVLIPYSAVSYSWRVEETDVQDRYTIVVETTFETNVPKPVVVVEPAVIDVGDLALPGDKKQVDLVFTNHGLIRASNLRLEFPTDLPDYDFDPLANIVPELGPNESVTIPVTVERNDPNDPDPDPVPDPNLPPPPEESNCRNSAGASYTFSYGCGGTDVAGGGSIAISGIDSSAGAGGGGGGSGGSERPCRSPDPYIKTPAEPETEEELPCDNCALQTYKEAAKCAINLVAGFIPGGGCVYGGLYQCAGGFLLDGTGPSAQWDCIYGLVKGCASSALGPVVPLLDCYCGLKGACPDQPASPGVPILSDYCAIDKAAKDTYGGYYKNLYDLLLDISGSGSSAGNDGGTAALRSGLRALSHRSAASDDLYAATDETALRVLAAAAYHIYVLGDLNWITVMGQPEYSTIVFTFSASAADASAEGKVLSAAESAALLALPRPAGLPVESVERLIARWNRSVSYWNTGILKSTDVPAGADEDFLAADHVRALAQLSAATLDAAAARVPGADPMTVLFDEHVAALEELAAALSDGGVCATVKLRLEQSAVLTRSGFRATLELSNGLADLPIDQISVVLDITDAGGLPAGERFSVRPPTLTGFSAIDGSGVINPSSTGSAAWIIVPNDLAAPATTTQYLIGGTLHYRQGTSTHDIPLAPAAINVLPDAALTLEYFHQTDVFSDDPDTTLIEPAEPFVLAVMISNSGAGRARDISISSADPEIVENEKGLSIGITIVGAELFEGAPGSLVARAIPPSLTVDIGDIGPGETKIAQWLLTSTLQGQFTDYAATFEHLDSLGDPRLSLIKSVGIHELFSQVTDPSGAPAFLVNDLADGRDLPDTMWFADGSSAPVSFVETASTVSTPTAFSVARAASPAAAFPTDTGLVVTLTAALPTGWSYLRVPDPADGLYRLTRVQRGDGSDLPLGKNVRISDRTFIGLGLQPLRENVLHLIDANSSGTYTLTYGALAGSDPTAPVSAVAALPATTASPFTVTWAGTDANGIADFDIYLSVDGADYTLWRAAVTATGAVFTGEVGRTYAFYSRARDVAGNLEDPPATPDAVTTVSSINRPPVLAAIADRTIDEGDTLALVATATDPDAGSMLTFALGDAPAGVVLSPTTGALSWATATSLSGQTYAIGVQVWDNGTPRLGDARTFNVTVGNVNHAPAFAGLGPQAAVAGHALIVMPAVTDVDATDTHTFAFVGVAPAGMTIDNATGRITWTPAGGDTGSVHEVQLRVTDSGAPALSATTAFAVTVRANPDEARESWATANFTADERADASISGDAADPNVNDRTNLMEYALGAPATAAFDAAEYLHTTVVLDTGDGRHHARLVYRQRKNDPRLVFYPEVSGDRTTWQGGATAIAEIARVSIDAEFDEVTVQDLTPVLPGAPRYFRLRVVRN